MLIGDHGTRFNENKNYQKLLNPEINQIGFFLKEKNKSFIKVNKNISIIDIYPSLVSKYNKKIFNKNNFDGCNSLYSKQENKILLSESLYKNKFSLMAKYNDYIYLINSDLNDDKYISDIKENFLNSKMETIKFNNDKNNKTYKLLKNFCSKHIKKNFKI